MRIHTFEEISSLITLTLLVFFVSLMSAPAQNNARVRNLKVYNSSNSSELILNWNYKGYSDVRFRIEITDSRHGNTRLFKARPILLDKNVTNALTASYFYPIRNLNQKLTHQVRINAIPKKPVGTKKASWSKPVRFTPRRISVLDPRIENTEDDISISPENTPSPTPPSEEKGDQPSAPSPSPIPIVAKRVYPKSYETTPRILFGHHTEARTERIPDWATLATVEVITDARWSDIIQQIDLETTDIVHIPEGVSVNFDVRMTSSIKALIIGGQFQFQPDIFTKLKVGTIHLKKGLFKVKPHRAVTAQIIFDGQLDYKEDPQQFAVGFLATGGIVDIEGVSPNLVYARPTTRLNPGTTSLFLDRDVDWQVGDNLFFAGVHLFLNHNQSQSFTTDTSEIATIKNINGRHIELTQSLKYMHEEGIGHISRNVILSSSEGSVRGHALFTHMARVSVKGAYLENMGRSTTSPFSDTRWNHHGTEATFIGLNPRGRYILHAHHLHTPVYFEKNVAIARADLRWAITLHASHGEISKNIVINSGGSGIVSENGFETGVFNGNIIFGNGGGNTTTERDGQPTGGLAFDGSTNSDFGFEGSGFWWRSKVLKLSNNITEGHFRGASFHYEPFFPEKGISSVTFPKVMGTHTGYEGKTLSDIKQAGAEFSNNASNSYREHYYRGNAFLSQWAGGEEPMIIDNFTVRHNGVFPIYGGPFVFKNSTFDGSGYDPGYIVNSAFAGDATSALTIDNCTIENYEIAVDGLFFPYGENYIKNSTLAANNINVNITGWGGNYLKIENVKFEKAITNIKMGTIINGSGPEVLANGKTNYHSLSLLSPSIRVVVTDYNQVKGDNFEVHFLQQAHDFRLQDFGNVTNQELFAGKGTGPYTKNTFGRSYNGHIVYNKQTRPKITGYVEPIRTVVPIGTIGYQTNHGYSQFQLKYATQANVSFPYKYSGGTEYSETIALQEGFNLITRWVPSFGYYTWFVIR